MSQRNNTNNSGNNRNPATPQPSVTASADVGDRDADNVSNNQNRSRGNARRHARNSPQQQEPPGQQQLSAAPAAAAAGSLAQLLRGVAPDAQVRVEVGVAASPPPDASPTGASSTTAFFVSGAAPLPAAPAIPPPPPPPPPPSPPPLTSGRFSKEPNAGCTVHLRFLPLDMTERELSSLLDQCGTVLRVRICRRDKHDQWTYGFVEFERPDQAERCVSSCSGRAVTSAKFRVQAALAKSCIGDRLAGDFSSPAQPCQFGKAHPERTLLQSSEALLIAIAQQAQIDKELDAASRRAGGAPAAATSSTKRNSNSNAAQHAAAATSNTAPSSSGTAVSGRNDDSPRSSTSFGGRSPPSTAPSSAMTTPANGLVGVPIVNMSPFFVTSHVVDAPPPPPPPRPPPPPALMHIPERTVLPAYLTTPLPADVAQLIHRALRIVQDAVALVLFDMTEELSPRAIPIAAVATELRSALELAKQAAHLLRQAKGPRGAVAVAMRGLDDAVQHVRVVLCAVLLLDAATIRDAVAVASDAFRDVPPLVHMVDCRRDGWSLHPLALNHMAEFAVMLEPVSAVIAMSFLHVAFNRAAAIGTCTPVAALRPLVAAGEEASAPPPPPLRLWNALVPVPLVSVDASCDTTSVETRVASTSLHVLLFYRARLANSLSTAFGASSVAGFEASVQPSF